jgi:8-oxo-dGTP pyrophosphatase MutT (NUDIX family)
MTNWKRKSRRKLGSSRRLTLYRDVVETSDGKKNEYPFLETKDGVVVIPVKVNEKNEPRFIMIEQYRYPIGRMQLEFPGGAREDGQTNEEAAHKELREETGYEAKSLKFMYSMNPVPSISPFKTSVYLATVEGEPEPLEVEDDEKAAGLSVKEFGADELLQMIRDNELTDCKAVAGLAVVLLQSPKALEYATSLV